MTRSKLLFTALALCLAPACDERANIGDRADAALPSDAFVSLTDAGPVDAASTDAALPPDAPLPNVGFIDVVVGTIHTDDRPSSTSLAVGVSLQATVPEAPSFTIVERFGPCEARQGTPSAAPIGLDAGARVSARVGGSGAFEPLGFVAASGFYGLTVTPRPADGTPVTVRIDLGARGTIERTLPVRALRLTAPTLTAAHEGSSVWQTTYTREADFSVAWDGAGRTGSVYFSARAADGTSPAILCTIDPTIGAFTLPWTQMNTYLVAPTALPPHFEVSNVDAITNTEAGISVRTLSSAQSGQTLLRP